MTVDELFKILELAIHDGHGHAKILFDTEAKTYEYHMAEVKAAYLNTEPFPDEPYISLHE